LLVAVRRNVLAKEIVNFNGLLVAHQRDDTETERLTGVVLFVFRLLDRGGYQRGHCKSFLAVDLTIAVGAGNAMRDSVWAKLDAAGVPQRLDAPIVGNHVAELNDFRHTAEMFDEAGCAAKRL